MNTLSTRNQVYRQVRIPANFVVRNQEDVEHFQISFNRVLISGRVLLLPEDYWHYRHTDKLVNTQLASDPFDAQKLIVIPLPTKAENGSARKQAAAAQDFRKPNVAQWSPDTAAQTQRLKATAKEFHPAALMQQQRTLVREPLRTPSPIPIIRRRSVHASDSSASSQSLGSPARSGRGKNIKLPECDAGSCSSSDALTEHEDFYPELWRKAGKAERRRKRHEQKRKEVGET